MNKALLLSIKQLGAINKTYRHLNRYQQILRVLFKYGFTDLVDHLHIDHYLETGLKMINRQPKEQLERLSRPVRLRMALEELGPTFIKLGQLLSTRPDFIPSEYLDELARLQDNVPPFSFDALQQIFEEEWGRPPEEIFAYFDKEPLAAASIGQVHQARFAEEEPDGEADARCKGEQKGKEKKKKLLDVVVKVQRPGLEKLIAVDLEILAHFARLMEENLEEVQGHQPTAVVHEFARSLSNEIDFTIELSSIQRFAHHFKNNKSIHVPEVFPAFSTERILVMERVRGIKSSDVETLKQRGYDLPLVAERGANLVMEQIFVHGFFHADPHPGNIFILPKNVICFIDFGQMGRLLRKDREDFTNLVLSLISGNENRVTAAVLKVTIQQGNLDKDALSLDLADFLDRYLYLSLGELQADKILQDLMDLVSRHKLSLKPNLYLMLKALSTVEGLGLLLNPQLELIALAQPFMKKIKVDRMKPKRLVGDLNETGRNYLTLLRDLPEEARSILSQLRHGKMRLEFEHRGLLPLQHALERISNRISFAIVLAAQIIGSSLIVLSGIPPHWQGIPLIGLAGFLVAGLMGFWLLISIIRHGNM